MPFGPLGRVWWDDCLIFSHPLGASVPAAPQHIRDLEADLKPLYGVAALKPRAQTGLSADHRIGDGEPVQVGVMGTAFQYDVWSALLDIPFGQTCHYGDLAQKLGSSPRAAGRAIGANRIAYYIPCHRVLPKAGGLGGFRWGLAAKRQFLRAEDIHLA
jgi:O-6-methylguanine DNA methyltransferase